MQTETRTAVVTFAAALAKQGFACVVENRGAAQGIEMIRDALGIMEAIRADGSPEAIVDMIQDCADIATIKALATDAIYLLDNEGKPPLPRQRDVAKAHADLLHAIRNDAGHGINSPGVSDCVAAGLLKIDALGLAVLTRIGRIALRTIPRPRCR